MGGGAIADWSGGQHTPLERYVGEVEGGGPGQARGVSVFVGEVVGQARGVSVLWGRR